MQTNEVTEVFLNKLNEKLINKEIKIEDSSEITKIVGEIFINNVLEMFPDLLEFNIKTVLQDNIILVKIETGSELTLVDIIIPVKNNHEILTINNVLISIKNM